MELKEKEENEFLFFLNFFKKAKKHLKCMQMVLHDRRNICIIEL
jgi:hypothetical protein